MRLILAFGMSVVLLGCGDDSGGGTPPPPVKYDKGIVIQDGPLPQPDAGAILPDLGNMCGFIGAYNCPSGMTCNSTKCGFSTGTCVATPSVCPSTSAPVCGCDAVTYQNDCYRLLASVAFWHSGACEPDVTPF